MPLEILIVFPAGTFVFAPFTQYLMDTYDGWRGACIILAGVFLNMVGNSMKQTKYYIFMPTMVLFSPKHIKGCVRNALS